MKVPPEPTIPADGGADVLDVAGLFEGGALDLGDGP